MRQVCLLDRTKNLHQFNGLHFISDSLQIDTVDVLPRAFIEEVDVVRVVRCGAGGQELLAIKPHLDVADARAVLFWKTRIMPAS